MAFEAAKGTTKKPELSPQLPPSPHRCAATSTHTRAAIQTAQITAPHDREPLDQDAADRPADEPDAPEQGEGHHAGAVPVRKTSATLVEAPRDDPTDTEGDPFRFTGGSPMTT